MISVVLNAKNEEEVIRLCLESCKWADETVVVLNDSTDTTEKIAREYTKNIFRIEGQDFAKVKNLGMEKTHGDWILFIDADERVLQPLKQEIFEIIKNDKCSAYAISRKNIIFGKLVTFGPYKHDWVIRFVKKADCKGWVGKIHEHLEFNGNLGYTKNSLLHLTHRGIDHFILKSLEWSNIDAKLRLESGHPPMSGWRFLRILTGEIWFQGIIRKGFFGGTVGIIDSILQVFFLYMTYVRLWQLQQPKKIEDIYRELDRKLLENEFRY